MVDYRCNSCDTNFSTRSTLSEHLDAKHLNDSNECFLCNKKISSKTKLSKHLKEIHFGLSPPKNIKCPSCPSLYDKPMRVYNHFNSTHHKIEDSEECSLCDFKDGNLRSHFLNEHCLSVWEVADRKHDKEMKREEVSSFTFSSSTKKRKISRLSEQSTIVVDTEELQAKDIQILDTLMKKHLGIYRNGRFNENLTIREKQKAGKRLGNLLNMVTDGAILPLLNYTLHKSQVQILANQKDIANSLLVEHLGIEDGENFISLSNENKDEVGQKLKHLLEKVSGDDLIQLMNCTLSYEDVQKLWSVKVIQAYETDTGVEDDIDNEDTMSPSNDDIGICSNDRDLDMNTKNDESEEPNFESSDSLSSEGEILDLTIKKHDIDGPSDPGNEDEEAQISQYANPRVQNNGVRNDSHIGATTTTTVSISKRGSIVKAWDSASFYKCNRCNKEGNYLQIKMHIRNNHDINGKLEFGTDFSGKIEYHKCLECSAMIECDPFFINKHMKSRHNKSLLWYETTWLTENRTPGHNIDDYKVVNTKYANQEQKSDVLSTPVEDPANPSGTGTPKFVHSKTNKPATSSTETTVISGDVATKMWNNTSSYMCNRCEEEGDYLKIYRHVSKYHGVKREMKPDVDFKAEIRYHMCFECEEMVKCDPFFISHHLKSKHRKTLSWYEFKYEEELMNNEGPKNPLH